MRPATLLMSALVGVGLWAIALAAVLDPVRMVLTSLTCFSLAVLCATIVLHTEGARRGRKKVTDHG